MGLAGQPLEILKRIPFFAELAPAELEALAEAVVVARYRKNQVLFVEGEPSHSLYFICRGRVKVYRVSPDGREQILHLLGDGDPISVVPFFDGDPYPANAEVLTDSEIAFIRFEDFERIARANPGILLQMLTFSPAGCAGRRKRSPPWRSRAWPAAWRPACWSWPSARGSWWTTAFRLT